MRVVSSSGIYMRLLGKTRGGEKKKERGEAEKSRKQRDIRFSLEKLKISLRTREDHFQLILPCRKGFHKTLKGF